MISMKYCTYVFLFFIGCFVTNGQVLKGTVLDSLTGKPLSYANIMFANNDKGTYCNEDGSFNFTVKNEKGPATFTYIGYKNKTLGFGQLQGGVVVMSAEDKLLDEVVINQTRIMYTGSKNLGLSKSAAFTRGIPFGSEFCGLIKNTYNKPGKLLAVNLELKKASGYDYLATYNIKFYEYDTLRHCPGRELYDKKVLVQPENKSYTLTVETDSLDIPFPESGICIGVQIINTKYGGTLNNMGRMAPLIVFTHTDRDILTWDRRLNQVVWHTGTTKSPVRSDFVNALIGIEVKIEK